MIENTSTIQAAIDAKPKDDLVYFMPGIFIDKPLRLRPGTRLVALQVTDISSAVKEMFDGIAKGETK